MKQSLSIYFIHASDLVMRKQVCENFLNKIKDDFNVTIKYILEDDPKDIDITRIKDMVKMEKSKTNDVFDVLLKNIHVKQLSNSLKHYKAYQEIEKSDDEFSLILEDDIIYSNDVVDNLKNVMDKIKANTEKWHIMFTGMPQPAGLNIKTPIINVAEIFKLLPVCDSYFVCKQNVGELMEKFLPIKYCTNIQLSYIITHQDIKAFMTVPNVFVDGSKYGMLLSSLESNNKLFLNPDYNKLVAIVNKNEYTLEDDKVVQSLATSMQFANHPDFLYQLGLYEMKRKNYSKAKHVFDSIYEIYVKNNSVMNSDCEFLYNYCNLFTHFQ